MRRRPLRNLPAPRRGCRHRANDCVVRLRVRGAVQAETLLAEIFRFLPQTTSEKSKSGHDTAAGHEGGKTVSRPSQESGNNAVYTRISSIAGAAQGFWYPQACGDPPSGPLAPKPARRKTGEMKPVQHKTIGGVLPIENRSHSLLTEIPIPLHLQRHFHVHELAKLWGVAPNTTRRWFENEPGVLKISIGYRRGKDHRVCLRIPESVAERVHRERSKVGV